MFSQLRYIMKYKIIEPCVKTFCTIIFGSKKITPIYSVEGLLSQVQFFIILFEIGVIYSIFGYFHNLLLSYIVGLFIFYAFLTSIQKRCRDYGSSGTYWILAFSIVFIVDMAFSFCNVQEADELLRHIYFVMVCIKLVVFLSLLLIPSKANVDERIRSPLLKHPLIYTLICVMLAIGATIGVNYYNGVNIL